MKQVKHYEREVLNQAFLAWKHQGCFDEYDFDEFVREVESLETAGWPQRVQDFVDGFRAATILYNNKVS